MKNKESILNLQSIEINVEIRDNDGNLLIEKKPNKKVLIEPITSNIPNYTLEELRKRIYQVLNMNTNYSGEMNVTPLEFINSRYCNKKDYLSLIVNKIFE